MKFIAEITKGKKFVVVMNHDPLYFQIQDLDTGYYFPEIYNSFDLAKENSDKRNLEYFSDKPEYYNEGYN